MNAGDVFGKWSLLALATAPGAHHPRWLCRCSCGTQKTVDLGAMRRGKSTSCGCTDFPSKSLTHGMSKAPILGVWRNIMSRCSKEYHASYKNYGARGVKVCDRWLTLQNFCADVGPHPGTGFTFERVDNDGDYEPGNVRWATWAEQSRNKRSNVFVEHLGRTLCIQDWGTELGVTANHLYRRHRKGMTWHQAIDDILANPPRNRGPYRFSKTKPTKEIT